jgi:hypothetical protein
VFFIEGVKITCPRLHIALNYVFGNTLRKNKIARANTWINSAIRFILLQNKKYVQSFILPKAATGVAGD